MLTIFAISSDDPQIHADSIVPLKNSCQRLGITIQIFWTKEPYKNSHDLKLIQVLKTIQALSSQYVMYIDAFDCLFVRPIDQLMETFLSFQKPIVMCTERSGRGHEYAHAFTHGHEGPYRFLNAGCFMGKREVLSHVIEEILQREVFHSITNFRDQPMWIRYYIDHPDAIALDHRCKLFQTITPNYQPTGLKKEHGELVCTFSGERPFILHAQSAKYLDPESKLLPEIMSFINDSDDGEFTPRFEHIVEEASVIRFETL